MSSIIDVEEEYRKNVRPLLNRRIRCPAVMLAVIRKASVRGRSTILVNSIKVINGASHIGVDAGRKEAKNAFTFILRKIKSGASHNINPRGNVIVGKVVIENVYGTRPVRLKKISLQKVAGMNISHPLNAFFHGVI